MKLTTPTVTVCSYASGLPMATTHSPTRSESESPSGGERERPRGIDLDERDIGIGVRADARRVQVPTVGQPHHDAVGAVDDVMVREDQTVGVDDEARAGAAAWALRIALARPIEQVGAVGHRQAAEPAAARRPARGGVDVDDRGIEPLGDIRKRHERG